MMKSILAATAALSLVAGGAMAADHHKKSKMTIVETAVATDSLSTLVAAVKAADLVDTLNGDGPFTVFAPTNDGFAAIQSTVDTLLEPENKKALQGVLTYHVVAGKVKAGDLVKMAEEKGS
ncbi:MAG: fasciclin domain-containing protein, partial [Pseudomonadota bacterium]